MQLVKVCPKTVLFLAWTVIPSDSRTVLSVLYRFGLVIPGIRLGRSSCPYLTGRALLSSIAPTSGAIAENRSDLDQRPNRPIRLFLVFRHGNPFFLVTVTS